VVSKARVALNMASKIRTLMDPSGILVTSSRK